MKIDIQISQEMLQLIAQIDEFKGRWEAFGAISRDRLTQLRKTATIESVGSSTRIEGSRLTDQEVEELLSTINIEKFDSRDKQEVAGYAQAMDLVFESWEYLRIDKNHIQQLHSTLLHHSTKDDRHRGSYKTLDNHVAAFDAQGKQVGIVFETSTPFDTPADMKDLLDWYQVAHTEKSVHPLLLTAVFIVRFLAVHPFQDGNGRLSRVLTTLMLLRSGYKYVPYASIERIVEDNKDAYYRALRNTQSSFKKDTVNWDAWVIFFLRTLWKQCEVLRAKVEDHQVMQAQGLTPLATQILVLFQDHSRLSNREIVALTSTSKNTVKVTLAKLVKENLIVSEGKGRSTAYRLK